MWWIFNTDTNAYVVCVDTVPADAANRFIRDYPHLEIRKLH